MADEQLWRPQAPPSPFVTHAEMGPVHSRLGSLEKGQEHVLNTYAHLRGEMLSHFAGMEKLIRESAPSAERGGVNLSAREASVIATALVLAGIVLSRVPGLEHFMGGG